MPPERGRNRNGNPRLLWRSLRPSRQMDAIHIFDSNKVTNWSKELRMMLHIIRSHEPMVPRFLT